eukprot:CAMPEP_0204258894 /NCGR_PEP_ID=MMETSP0468-20130131/5223_1 /ASSEMBLY_ACC=CAM_ASM_000383 /TAXON_ID=2969 /ORGANISM="Oxyrrhis marina" /LENGTH=236 /DNA_ID=CAMNT_0051233099 /DNA_START=24 /DNA_END=734 /DNA_ORIENTATION=+
MSLTEDPNGSWTCVCGNVNYPFRNICNRKTCSLPRDGGAGKSKGGGSTFGKGGIGDWSTFGAPAFKAPRPPTQSWGNPFPQTPAVDGGNWMCECGNENFPHRTYCNRKVCSKPRPGLSAPSFQPARRPRPTTQWAAPYPTQVTIAQQPWVPAPIHVAAPRAAPRKAPLGSWKCECGNVNFPSRTSCNRNTCSKPRETSETVDAEILKVNMKAAADAEDFEEAARLKRELQVMTGEM